MKKITNFKNPDGACWASWELLGKEVRLTSEGRLIAVVSPAGNIVVVKIHRSYGKNNAFLFGPDGEVIKRINNPINDAVCFDDAFFDGSELVIIAGAENKRVANVVDDNGDIVKSYITM